MAEMQIFSSNLLPRRLLSLQRCFMHVSLLNIAQLNCWSQIMDGAMTYRYADVENLALEMVFCFSSVS